MMEVQIHWKQRRIPDSTDGHTLHPAPHLFHSGNHTDLGDHLGG